MFHYVSPAPPLQATISSASVGDTSGYVGPHNPITCSGDLEFDEANVLRCSHSFTKDGDPRLDQALIATVAILLFELVYERFGDKP